jgi:hypothetical protein
MIASKAQIEIEAGKQSKMTILLQKQYHLLILILISRSLYELAEMNDLHLSAFQVWVVELVYYVKAVEQ